MLLFKNDTIFHDDQLYQMIDLDPEIGLIIWQPVKIRKFLWITWIVNTGEPFKWEAVGFYPVCCV